MINFSVGNRCILLRFLFRFLFNFFDFVMLYYSFFILVFKGCIVSLRLSFFRLDLFYFFHLYLWLFNFLRYIYFYWFFFWFFNRSYFLDWIKIYNLRFLLLLLLIFFTYALDSSIVYLCFLNAILTFFDLILKILVMSLILLWFYFINFVIKLFLKLLLLIFMFLLKFFQ